MAYRDNDNKRVYLDRDASGELKNGKNSNKAINTTNRSNGLNKVNRYTENKYTENKYTENNNSDKNNKIENKNKRSSKTNLEDYDEKMQQEILLEIKRIEKRRKMFITAFLIIGLVSIGYALFYYTHANKSERRWNDIANLVDSKNLQTDVKTTVTATLSNEETRELTILDKYATLYNLNKKLIGWLKIDDTLIDYPVMQCDNNTYYLDHNFDQKEDKVGTLFLDYQCDVVNESDNYIIYGHHLQSGKMFSSLENYQSEKFYQNHKYITFDTIYEEHQYEVMYVFRSKVYNDNDMVFKYYQFIDANSAEEFNSHMNEMKKMSFYDTGVTASYGDHLLTLSTCDYQENNGRFVVVAKRIK